MQEFMSAAFPWILTGIAIAIACAGSVRNGEEKEKKEWQQLLGGGLGFGLLVGVMLNICGFWENHAIGLSIGSLFGVMMASLWKANHDKL